MKVAFVDFTQFFHDKQAIYCLSAYLKHNGIETYYINKRRFSQAISQIKRITPALLLYSAFSRDIGLFIKFDKVIKEILDIKSVIGGPGPTFDRCHLKNSTIDALCIGEGEYAIVDFIRNGFSPSRNIISNQDEMPSEYASFVDLNVLSFPDREIVYKNDYILRNIPSKQFLSGRGCPYMCTYCHNNIQNKMFKSCGPIVRKKSVDYLIDEIKDVKLKYPLKTVVFNDDTFILKRKWLFEFCERFPREIGLPYTCNIRANLIDEGVVEALKESNCVGVYWSIESGNEFYRNHVLNRSISKEQILRTGYLLKKYKIPYRSGGMIGLPGENFEEMLETLELNIKVAPQFGFAHICIPFPGLEITEYALKHNYLTEESLNNLPYHFHQRSPMKMTSKENLLIQKLTFLYPICVNYPILFHNRRIFNMLFKLPRALLYVFSEIFSGYKMSRLYKVKTSLLLKIAILWRYLKNPF